jgi:hypothetical protein
MATQEELAAEHNCTVWVINQTRTEYAEAFAEKQPGTAAQRKTKRPQFIEQGKREFDGKFGDLLEGIRKPLVRRHGSEKAEAYLDQFAVWHAAKGNDVSAMLDKASKEDFLSEPDTTGLRGQPASSFQTMLSRIRNGENPAFEALAWAKDPTQAKSAAFKRVQLATVQSGAQKPGTEYFHYIQNKIAKTARDFATANPNKALPRENRLAYGERMFRDRFNGLLKDIEDILLRQNGQEKTAQYLNQFQSWLAATGKPMPDLSKAPFKDFPGKAEIAGRPQDSLDGLLEKIRSGKHPLFPEFAAKPEPEPPEPGERQPGTTATVIEGRFPKKPPQPK